MARETLAVELSPGLPSKPYFEQTKDPVDYQDEDEAESAGKWHVITFGATADI